MVLGQINLPKHASHPHAALLYVDFELSKLVIYQSIDYNSPRKDIPGAKNYKKFYGAQSTKDVLPRWPLENPPPVAGSKSPRRQHGISY